jgi:hypothetical protein
MSDEITYRILPPEEWEKLIPIYPTGLIIPPSDTSIAAVAECNGELVAFWFLQIALHMEPLLIKDGLADYHKLAALLKEALPQGVPFLSSVPDEKMAHIAESVGMQATGWQLYAGVGGA